MAEMTIHLRIDPATGKKDIVVALHGDADLLPQEHEHMHRTLVEKLIHGGLLKPSEVGQVVVERDDKEKTGLPAPLPVAEQQREARAQHQ